MLKKNSTQEKVENISRFSPVGPGGIYFPPGSANFLGTIFPWELTIPTTLHYLDLLLHLVKHVIKYGSFLRGTSPSLCTVFPSAFPVFHITASH